MESGRSRRNVAERRTWEEEEQSEREHSVSSCWRNPQPELKGISISALSQCWSQIREEPWRSCRSLMDGWRAERKRLLLSGCRYHASRVIKSLFLSHQNWQGDKNHLLKDSEGLFPSLRWGALMMISRALRRPQIAPDWLMSLLELLSTCSTRRSLRHPDQQISRSADHRYLITFYQHYSWWSWIVSATKSSYRTRNWNFGDEFINGAKWLKFISFTAS